MTRLGFDGDEGNDIQLDDVFYRFPLRSREYLWRSVLEPRDFIDVVSLSLAVVKVLFPDLVVSIPSLHTDESSGFGFDLPTVCR